MKFGNISVREDRTGRSIAFFVVNSGVTISKNEIRAMIKWSKNHANRDLRLCLHKEKNDRFHQMIILLHRGSNHRQHKENREESYHMIQGRMEVILFDNGSIKKRIVLDPKDTPVYRMAAHTWHSTVPLTPIVIFHEAKLGPYSRSDITYAPK